MQPHHDLGATLIAGRDRAAIRAVGAMLLGRAPGTIVGPDSVPSEPPESSADLALALADQLGGWADAGRRGSVIVELDERVDTSEVGLVLCHALSEREPDAARVTVHDLIAVASVAEIARLLFRRGSPEPSDTDDSSEHLAGQLEFASAIVLSDFETTPVLLANECLALVRRLAPRAGLYSLSPSGRLVRHGVATRPRVDELGSSAGWMLELSGHGRPAVTTAGISVTTFRDPRPFHPQRLAELIEDGLDPGSGVGLIVRSRGFVRLATRADQIGSWASAGAVLALGPTGMPSWSEDAPLGQEIVVFGRDLDADLLTARLAECLLTPDELVAGPMTWNSWADPFPSWHAEHEH